MATINSLDRCLSVKNKSETDIQCPRQRKVGDYCGIHHRSKNVTRYDYKKVIEPRIIINLTFKKPASRQEEKREPELYDDLEYISELGSERLNYAKLIKTLKHFQIQIQGTKKKLIESLVRYIKSSELISRAYDNPELCNNTTDFYDFVELREVPKEYLFIFICEDGLLYGMDLRSMYSYFNELEKDAKLMERVVEYINPYNRCKLNVHTICRYRNRIKVLENQNKPVKYPDEEHDPEDKMTFKVLEVFHTIYNYGYAVDASWFLNMSKIDLLDFYLVMEDIWNHRLNLSLSNKRNIVPNNLNIFNKAEYYEIREHDKLALQNIMIGKVEQMINNGIDRENRILGIHYILLGLSEVCELEMMDTPFGEE